MLTLNSLHKSFGDHVILDNVSLSVEEGQIIGLAGPSGSGKSTLLRCIQQLETMDAGSIECQVSTGFMFQDFQLFPHMTVLENLMYAPKIHDKKTDHTLRAMELLDKLKLIGKQDAYPSQLSGGQKQRAALARTLMMSPAVLLCDEPTSGLDMVTIDEVIDLLMSIKQMGITMLIASHDLDFLSKISDRLILLRNGQITADLSSEQLNAADFQIKALYSDEAA